MYLCKKAEIHKIREDLANFNSSFINTVDRNVETMWQAFKKAIQNTIDKRVPTKMSQGRHTHPWINTTIRRKINQKNKAHRKARKTNKKRDMDRYKRLKQEAQWEVRQANKKYMEEVSTNYKDNSKNFWSYIKSKGQEWTGVAPLKNKLGFLQSDNKSKAEILNDQFQSVFTKEHLNNFPNKGKSPYSTMDDIKISTKGWESLEERRKTNRLFKIQHGLIDIDRQQYLIPNDRRTRGIGRFSQERTKTDTYGQSFFPKTIRDWNQFPSKTTLADTIEGFRAALKACPERK
ncbi:unnamed protein product [Mytilus coruscus]|uniref:Uncharacterized protein n=1 Tax=Mytilus coruscus TaxID=42192 RepID=A0A6J8CDJ5_MYTCO|nr:unnamed protein product [Mytilus coruscus]